MEEIFEEVYNKIYESSKKRLAEVKKSNTKFILVAIVIGILINLVIYFDYNYSHMTPGTIATTIAVIIFLSICGKNNLKKVYKKEVISALVKGYNESLSYDTEYGITKMQYKVSHFDSRVDEFFSEDKISGRLRDGSHIQIAEVVSKRVDKYQDGDTVREEHITLFRGMYGIVKLNKNMLTNVKIATDTYREKFNKNRIEIDSALFEENYDIITEDRITALRVFTSDLIDKFNDLREHGIKAPLELKIESEMLYFRFKCGKLFEPPTFKDPLDKDLLKEYFRLIYYPIELIEQISENITNVVDQDQ